MATIVSLANIQMTPEMVGPSVAPVMGTMQTLKTTRKIRTMQRIKSEKPLSRLFQMDVSLVLRDSHRNVPKRL